MSNCDTHSVVGGGVCPPGIVMRPPPPTDPNYSQNEKSHVDLSNAYPEGDHVELNDSYRTIKHHSVEYHGSNETSDYNGESTEYHANSKTGDYNNETSEYHNGTSKASDETSAEYLRDTIASKENGQINNHNSSENYQVSSQLDEIARKEMFLREEIKREMTIQQSSNQMQQQVSGKETFLASPGSSTVENGKDLARTTNESYGMSDGTEVASKDMYINERPLSGKEPAHIPTVAPRAENFNSSVANLPISGKEMFLTENSDRNEKANSESAVTRTDSNHMQMMDKEICTMDGEDRKDLTLQQHTMPEGFPGPSQMQQMMGKEMFMAGNDYARQNYLMGQMEASRGNTLMDLGVRDPESSRHFLSQLEMAGIRPFPGMRVFPVKETGGRGRPRGSKKQYFDPSERPFKCKLCGKGFRQKAVLMQHDRTHTNERPYSCTECEKAFRQQTHLVQHMRIHTGEKPYDCQYCSRSFRQKAILDQHERIHTGEKPYQCTLCEKAFRQKAILDTHLRKHMGIKPFLCYICEKAFSQKSILNEHLKLHAASEEGGMKLALKKRGRKKKSEMDRLSYLMKPDFGNPSLPGTSGWLQNMSPRSVASSSDSGLPSPPGQVSSVPQQQTHYGEAVDVREREASRAAERTTWESVRTPESSSSVPDGWHHRVASKANEEKTERFQTPSQHRHGPLNQVSSSPAQQHQTGMEEGRQGSFYPSSGGGVSSAMSPPPLPVKQNYSYSPPAPLPFYTTQGPPPPQLQALGLHRMAPYLHAPSTPNPSNPASALDPRIPFTTHLQMLKK